MIEPASDMNRAFLVIIVAVSVAAAVLGYGLFVGDAPARPPILLIGADALDLELIGELTTRGGLPTISRMIEEGTSGVLLSEREMRSPALWTTIATGYPRTVHAIYDFVTGSRFWPPHLRTGEQRLVTSRDRRVPAVWTLAGNAGRRVAVVGWLNTWPAERVNGVMVAPYVALGASKQHTIKGAIYRDEERQVQPAPVWDEIRDLVVSSETVPAETVARLVGPDDEALLRTHPLLREYEEELRWSLAHSLTVHGLTRHLVSTRRFDLTMVFFEASDSLAHRFWLFRQPEREVRAQLFQVGYPTELAGRLKARYGRVVDRYYALLDELVADLIDRMPADPLVIVVSDHGFGPRSGRHPVNPEVPFTGEHRLEGTFIAWGPGVPAGERISGATIYDITPTLLSLLGVDSPIRLRGRALLPATAAGREKARIAGEDRTAGEDRSPGTPEPPPFEANELRRLRGLGYVE